MPGCSGRRGPGLPPPSPPLSEAEAARLLAETASLGRGIRRYQAVLAVRGEGRRGRFSGRLLVIFERPDEGGDANAGAVASLRMELFGPVGGARWTLVAALGRVGVVVPGERAFAEGSELGEFTEALLGVSVGLEGVAALLVGSGIPIPAGAAARPNPRGGSAVLDSGEEIRWDTRGDGPAQVVRAAAAEYEARYPDSWRRDGKRVPRRVEVVSGQVSARLEVEELEVNTRLHPDSFRLRTPAGFRRAAIRDLGRAMRLPER